MAGTHNFQVFDAANVNMTGDADYAISASRLNGVDNGVADPLLANKTWHQTSVMAAAIAQFLANNGQTISDTDLASLTTAISNVLVTLSTASYADRISHGLTGSADIGVLTFCAAQPTPAAATYVASGTGNLNGAYRYREVLISGYKNPDGTYFVRGFSPAASRSSADASPSSQQVTIASLPIGAPGCIGRAIYRSAAGGAAGSEQWCGIIWDNTTTTYTDNKVDSQLGTGMPTVQGTAIPAAVPTANTTGTSLSAAQIVGAIKGATLGGSAVTVLNQMLQLPSYPTQLPANGGTANAASYATGSVALSTPALRNIQQSTAQASYYLGLGVINVVTD